MIVIVVPFTSLLLVTASVVAILTSVADFVGATVQNADSLNIIAQGLVWALQCLVSYTASN